MKNKIRLADRFILCIVPVIGFLLIRLLGRTWRYTTVGGEKAEKVQEEGTSLIYALWHGRMLPLAYCYRNRSACALVSQHRDGELASRIAEKLGFRTIRGSSTRGGVKGSQKLLRQLTSGFDAAIMPDGPKGPARKVQAGVLRLAQLSGCPIVPVTVGVSKCMTLKSWDGFIIPKPFAKCVVFYGNPVRIPPDAPSTLLEAKRTELEENLNTITHEADSFFN